MAKTYTTKLGDTWDVISLIAYNSELFTAELVKANWEHRDVGMFGAGIVLSLPTVSLARRDDTNLPPWRRGR